MPTFQNDTRSSELKKKKKTENEKKVISVPLVKVALFLGWLPKRSSIEEHRLLVFAVEPNFLPVLKSLRERKGGPPLNWYTMC